MVSYKRENGRTLCLDWEKKGINDSVTCLWNYFCGKWIPWALCPDSFVLCTLVTGTARPVNLSGVKKDKSKKEKI